MTEEIRNLEDRTGNAEIGEALPERQKEIRKKYSNDVNRWMSRVCFPSGILTLASMISAVAGHVYHETRQEPQSVIQYREQRSELGRIKSVKDGFGEIPELESLYSRISEPLDEIISTRESRLNQLKESDEYKRHELSSPFENDLFRYGVFGFGLSLAGALSGIPVGFWYDRRKNRELAELEDGK